MKKALVIMSLLVASLVPCALSHAQDDFAVRQLRASGYERLLLSNQKGWVIADSSAGLSQGQDTVRYLFGPNGYQRAIDRFFQYRVVETGPSSAPLVESSYPVGIDASGAVIIATSNEVSETLIETTFSRLERDASSAQRLFMVSSTKIVVAKVNGTGQIFLAAESSDIDGNAQVKVYQFVAGRLSEVKTLQLRKGTDALIEPVIDDGGNLFLSVIAQSKRTPAKLSRIYARGSTAQGALQILDARTTKRLARNNAFPVALSSGIITFNTYQGVLTADIDSPDRLMGARTRRVGPFIDLDANATSGATFLTQQNPSKPIVLTEVTPGAKVGTYICRGFARLFSQKALVVHGMRVQDATTVLFFGDRQSFPDEEPQAFVKVVLELKRVAAGTPAAADEIDRCKLRE